MTTTTLTPRLEIASRAMQGMLVGADDIWEYENLEPTAKRNIVAESIGIADALLAADSQSGTDVSEMARTIQRLEGRVEFLRTALEQAANTWDSDRREQAMHNALNCIRYAALNALSKDTEVAR